MARVFPRRQNRLGQQRRHHTKNVRLPYKAPKYVLVFNVHIPLSCDEHAAKPSRAPQQPDARTSIPCEELQRELRRAGRDPLGDIPHPTNASAAHRGPRRLLGRVVILAFGGRASASTDGGQ